MADEPLSFTYKVYRIEKNEEDFSFLVGKYAALSLRALSSDPGAFGLAYITEASWTAKDYSKRLLRENVDVFVCVAHSPDAQSEVQSIDRGSWVAMVVQIGPTPKRIYWLPDSGCPEPREDDLETKWHQTATWVDPAHRGKGIAGLLLEAAVDHARWVTERRGGTHARLRAFTGPDNEASKGLYGHFGFPAAGRCTIAEGMAANGNADWPFHGRGDWPEEMLHTRQGVIMERVVDVSSARE